MNIYKLTFIESEKNNPKWKVSHYKDEMIIRTISKSEARILAKQITKIAGVKQFPGENTDDLSSPWLDENLVDCKEYHESEFSVEGEEEILKPAHLNVELRKNYQIRRMLRSLHELNPFSLRLGNEVGYLDGTYQSIDAAKKAIAIDKQEFGDTYKYIVAKNVSGRNVIVYEE